MTPLDLTKKNTSIDSAYNADDYARVFSTYKDPATTYCKDVLAGDIIAGYTIKLACLRHIRDLQRSIDNDPEFPYSYDLNHVRTILNFAALTPNPDSGTPEPLMPWQQFVLSLCIGWRRNSDGGKRFSKVIFSVARTNGKTMLTMILAAYAYLIECNGLNNQDLCLLNATAKQSKKGWSYLISTMNHLSRTLAFKKLMADNEVLVQEQSVRSRTNRNNMMPLSAESGQVDGYHFLTAIIDESADPSFTSELIGKVSSGMIQIPGAQMIQISTAYNNPDVPFRKAQVGMREVMERDFDRVGDDTLMVVYEQDDQEETNDPMTWVKSNPILSLQGKGESMLQSMIAERDSKTADGTVSDFMVRNLNLWVVNEKQKFLHPDDIQSAVTDKPFDITGADCYVGFDYSVMDDNTSLVFTFPYLDDEGKECYHVTQHSFIPTRQVDGNVQLKEKQDGIQYRKAQANGYCSIAQNAAGYVDPDELIAYLLDYIESNQLNVKCFVYDPYGVNAIIRHLEANTDMPMIALPQKPQYLSEPTKELQKLFREGRIKFNDDEILIKSLEHAELDDTNNAVRLSKARKSLKIDTAAALVDSIAEAMYHFQTYGRLEDKSKDIWKGVDPNEYFKTQFSF